MIMADFNPDAYLASKQAQPPQGFDPDAYLKSKESHPYLDTLKSVLGAREAYKQGMLNAASLNYIPMNKEVQAASPIASKVGQAAGSVGVGTVAGAATPAIEGAGLLSAAGRIGSAGAVGAGLGAAQKPDEGQTRLGNAATGGILGAGAGTAAEGISRVAPQAMKWVGGKMVGISPQAAEEYASNPHASEAMYDMAHNNPKGFLDQTTQDLDKGLQGIQENVVNPKVEELNKTMIGKNFRVSPEDFKGTAVEKEALDAFNKQGNTVEQPLSDADRYISGNKTESVPAPLPDNVSLTGPQMLRAKRAAFEAANFNAPRNGLGYSAAETAQAQAEGAAGAKLRSAMESSNPKMAELNDQIEEALRYKNNAQKIGNPTQLLNPSDSLGGLDKRALRQYIDEASGGNLEQKARMYEAAEALNHTSNSVDKSTAIRRLLTQPAAKGLLKEGGQFTPSRANSVAKGLIGTYNSRNQP